MWETIYRQCTIQSKFFFRQQISRAVSPERIQEIINNYDQERKNLRKIINSIALFTNGSYTVQDLHSMTLPQIEEIQQLMKEKSEAEKQAIDKARGRNTKKYQFEELKLIVKLISFRLIVFI